MQTLNLDQLSYKIFIPGIIILSVIFMVVASIKDMGGDENIWIEAEEAKFITAGLEIKKDIKASGGKAIISKLRSHQRGAFASYDFNVIQSGKFFFWARTLWPGGCNNTFQITLDKSPVYKIGNDHILYKWHWINQREFELSQGKHNLLIYNDEHLAQLDKVLLTSDPYYIPAGFGISSDFYIDFTGGFPDFMLINNIEYFEIQKENNTQFLYIKPSKDSTNLDILFDKKNNSKFAFEVKYRSESSDVKQDLGLLFNYTDKNNYSLIEISNNKIEYRNVYNGMSEIIHTETSSLSYLDTTFKTFTIICDNSEIKFKIDGRTIFNSKVHSHNYGITGIRTKYGRGIIGSIYNVIGLSPYFTENFFYWEESLRLINGQNKMTAEWHTNKGHWESSKYKGIMSLEGSVKNGEPASIVFGKNYWQDYYIETAIKLMSKEAGIYFYYNDENNYYLLKSNGENQKLSLFKVFNSNYSLLKEIDYDFNFNEWYKIRAIKYKDSIYVVVDDQNVIQIYDNTFTEGKTGLWTNGYLKTNLFDDISVIEFNPKDLTNLKNVYAYNFEMREKAGIDFCDWENSGMVFKEMVGNNSSEYVYIEKPTLANSFIKNKKTFNGNINISWNTSLIPKDVDVVCKFDTRNGVETNLYEFILSMKNIVMRKNNVTVLTKRLENIPRNNIKIVHNNKKWHVNSGNNNCLEYIDETLIDGVNLIYGFTGIGKGKIFIRQIKIEDNIDVRNTN